MENKSEVLQVRLSPTLYERLKTQAALDGLKKSELARFIISDFFSTRRPEVMPVEPTNMRTLKRELLRKRGKKCEICGKKVNLTKEPRAFAHHRHYRTKGHERPQDVSILCKGCHGALHERSKVRKLNGKDVPFVDPRWKDSIMRARPVEPLIKLCEWEMLAIVLRHDPPEHIGLEIARHGTKVRPNTWEFKHENSMRLCELNIEEMWQKHNVELAKLNSRPKKENEA